MKLLVTGPLGLSTQQIAIAIVESKFVPKILVVTEEFAKAPLLLPIFEGGSWERIISIPLSERDFGPCAREVRLFEMVNQSEAVLILAPRVKMPPDGVPYSGEPGIKLNALLNLAKKSQLEIKIIEIDL